MNKMKTAVFHDVEKIVVETCEIPKVTNNKILMKVDVCALCTWEQRVYTGVKKVEYPFIGGHEVAGEIVEIGKDVDKHEWKVGDKIVHGTFGACGNCYYCKTNEEQNCIRFDHSKHLEGLPHKGMGGLSQYLLIEPKHAFKYYNVSPNEAALTEPLSCVIHSSETADIQYGDYVVVVGCGIMGMLHCLLGLKSGAVVIASDMDTERTKLAKELGVHYVHNPSEGNLKEFVMNITNHIGAQVIFDTTPISSVAESLVESLANVGTLVLYSSFYPDTPVSFSPDSLHKKGQRIVGTANSNSRDFMRAIRMLSEGIINVKPFINEIFPLNEVEKAFETAIKGNRYRVQVELHEDNEI